MAAHTFENTWDNQYLKELIKINVNSVAEEYKTFVGAGNPLQERIDGFIGEATDLLAALTARYDPATSRTKARSQRYRIIQASISSHSFNYPAGCLGVSWTPKPSEITPQDTQKCWELISQNVNFKHRTKSFPTSG